ncbi:hypothetical protein D3C84_1233240 [compost metagenome]
MLTVFESVSGFCWLIVKPRDIYLILRQIRRGRFVRPSKCVSISYRFRCVVIITLYLSGVIQDGLMSAFIAALIDRFWFDQ